MRLRRTLRIWHVENRLFVCIKLARGYPENLVNLRALEGVVVVENNPSLLALGSIDRLAEGFGTSVERHRKRIAQHDELPVIVERKASRGFDTMDRVDEIRVAGAPCASNTKDENPAIAGEFVSMMLLLVRHCLCSAR